MEIDQVKLKRIIQINKKVHEKKTIAESKIRLDWVLFVSIEIQLDKQTDNKKRQTTKSVLNSNDCLG